MIDKNSEVQTISEIRGATPDEGKFFDSLERETKKKNGHGEDITLTIFSVHPELFKKKMPTSGDKNAVVLKGLSRQVRDISLSDTHSTVKKHDTLLRNAAAKKEAKVSNTAGGAESSSAEHKVAEPKVARTAHESQQVQPGLQRQSEGNIPAAALPAKVASKHDDESSEKTGDSLKLQAASLSMKSELTSARQEAARPEMPSRASQMPTAERRLQVNSSEQNNAGIRQKQSLNIDYPFVRWSGEHSVKVSIPSEQHRVGSLTLQPSDSRAAEMLSRQANQLTGYNTELLPPHKEEDESEHRQARQAYEEDQE